MDARTIVSNVYDDLSGDTKALMATKKSLVKKVRKWKSERRGELPKEPKDISELGNVLCLLRFVEYCFVH